jgi:hypothetical protein
MNLMHNIVKYNLKFIISKLVLVRYQILIPRLHDEDVSTIATHPTKEKKKHQEVKTT